MSKASVKKALKELDHEGLVNLLMDLYACRKEAKDFMEFWADPDEDKELERIKERIHKLFFLPHDKPRRKPDMTEIKTLVKNFRTLGPDSEKIADLLIYLPEQMLEWLQRRNGTGMTAARSRFDSMLEDSRTFIESAAWNMYSACATTASPNLSTPITIASRMKTESARHAVGSASAIKTD